MTSFLRIKIYTKIKRKIQIKIKIQNKVKYPPLKGGYGSLSNRLAIGINGNSRLER